jgi:hypothetical protein
MVGTTAVSVVLLLLASADGDTDIAVIAGVTTEVSGHAARVVLTRLLTIGTAADVTIAPDVGEVFTDTKSITLVGGILITVGAALADADRTFRVQTTGAGAVTGAVLTTATGALVDALGQRISVILYVAASAGSITDLADCTTVINVCVVVGELVTEAGTVAAGAGVTVGGVGLIGASTLTVTDTATETVSGTLLVRVSEGLTEHAASDKSESVALLTVAVAGRVTADAVHAAPGGAVVVELTVRTFRVVHSTLVGELVAVSSLIAL